MTTATRPLAVVTGASSEIGLELAKQFARHDFDVVLAAEDAELSTAADEVRAGGARVESAAARLLPDEAKAKQQGKLMKPGSADA